MAGSHLAQWSLQMEISGLNPILPSAHCCLQSTANDPIIICSIYQLYGSFYFPITGQATAQEYQQVTVKTIHRVFGAGIRTHDL